MEIFAPTAAGRSLVVIGHYIRIIVIQDKSVAITIASKA